MSEPVEQGSAEAESDGYRRYVLGVLVVGTLEVIAGNLSLGQLFQFLLLISVMVWPLIAISWLLGTLQRARAAAERIEGVFAAEPEPRTGERPTLRGRIEVRDLDFSYPGESRAALSPSAAVLVVR